MACKLLRVPGLFILFGGLLVITQVRGDDAEVDKRHLSVLARTGQLPVQGKRYVAALAKNGELSSFTRPAWNKKLLHAPFGPSSQEEDDGDFTVLGEQQKRYVGALARTGDLRFSRYRDEKRDDVDTLLEELLTAEELRRLRREELREELLMEQEQEEEEESDAEKRSLASLARGGGMPYAEGKRGIAYLAKNGDFPWSGKRGGIASLMRSRLSNKIKRSSGFEGDLENALDELSEEDEEGDGDGFYAGKRSLASFAKSGGLSGLNYRNEKKDALSEWAEGKRNVQALARNRMGMSPLLEGKRYLGAFFASNGRPPYSGRGDPTFKRNIGSMARTWGYTPDRYNKMGKRLMDEEDDEVYSDGFLGPDEVAKRYVAALLRQGRLPVGVDAMSGQAAQAGEQDENKEEEEMEEEEAKRHIGSIAAHSSFAMRKKKSVDPKEQDAEREKTHQKQEHSQSGQGQAHSDDNKTGNDIEKTPRVKRQALFESASASDEYPMPVLQNTVTSDYEDIVSKATGDGPSARNKRYFAVRGGGKIPGGRLPQIGSSRRSHNANSGRRRGGHYQ